MRALLIAVAVLELALLCAGKPSRWNELDGYNFDKYIREFNKGYEPGSDVYKFREGVFNRKLKDIREHNSNTAHTWKKGVNEFSDMTSEEWKSYNKAFKHPNRPAPLKRFAPGRNTPLPHEVDWRTATSPRVLSNVKHQGSCGNCWAHSATETIESHYALITGQSAVLSTQQITSCTPQVFGCGGGDAVMAYMYVNTTTGLTEEWAYPFVDFFANISTEPTSKCKNISKEYPATPYTWFAYLNEAGVYGYGAVQPNDGTSAMQALSEIGPLSISVAAGNWQDYETGVFQNTDAYGYVNEWQVDHDVQMVGYGHDKELGHDYWIVRNSWGTMWGEDGFIRLDRPQFEPCSPEEFGPVCGTSGCLNDPHWPLVHNNTAIEF